MERCIVCGKLVEKPAYRTLKGHICSDECFDKDFWEDIIRQVNVEYWKNLTDRSTEECDHKYAIVDGNCYCIAPDNDNTYSFRGFGGREFIIEFNDGVTVVTHNLWHRGSVPEEYKEILKDNAKWR